MHERVLAQKVIEQGQTSAWWASTSLATWQIFIFAGAVGNWKRGARGGIHLPTRPALHRYGGRLAADVISCREGGQAHRPLRQALLGCHACCVDPGAVGALGWRQVHDRCHRPDA